MPVELPSERVPIWYPTSAVLLAAVILLFDIISPMGFAIAVLYALVVVIGAAFLDPRAIRIVAATCAVFTVVGYIVGHSAEFHLDALIRCMVSLSAIAVTTFLALRNAQSLLQLRRQAALLELTHDAIFVLDAHGRISYWNRGAEELYGWSAQEAIGQSAAELLRTDTPEACAGTMQLLERHGRWDGERVRIRKDGSRVPVLSRMTLHRDEQGRPSAIMETSNDISERKRAEERSKAAEEEMRRVVDTIPAYVWSSSPLTGAVDYINGRWSDMGWSLKEIGDSRWTERIHPDDVSSVEGAWDKSLTSGNGHEVLARFAQKEGGHRWMMFRAAPLRDNAGTIVRWYGVAADIEDRKRAEDALSRAHEELTHISRIAALGELAASIAHEVNQPLAAVVTNAEAGLRWLSRTPPNLEAGKTSLEKVVANARRASDVIVKLRAMARRSAFESLPVDVNTLIEETLALLQREFERHRIRVEKRLTPDLAITLGDRVQLQQVIINLIVDCH